MKPISRPKTNGLSMKHEGETKKHIHTVAEARNHTPHHRSGTTQSAHKRFTPWQIVQIARHPDRPVFKDYIDRIFTGFIELHGDRCYQDDQALIGGFAMIGNHKVMLLGHNKGKTIDEKVHRNFGSAHPDGYRKALRLMKLAQKFNIPIVSFVDTSAAAADKEAEERGQPEAIAHNLVEIAGIKVPIIVIITGEGGSGGALATGVGDIICMLSYAIFSVIPPEGCASILWREASPENTERAAEALKITAPSLFELGVIDEIVPEPVDGAHTDPESTVSAVRESIIRNLSDMTKVPHDALVEKRFKKYCRMGQFSMV